MKKKNWEVSWRMPKTCTLPETNIRVAPENRPKRPKRKLVTSLPNIHFQVRLLLVLGRVLLHSYLPYFQPKMTSEKQAITSRVVSRSSDRFDRVTMDTKLMSLSERAFSMRKQLKGQS